MSGSRDEVVGNRLDVVTVTIFLPLGLLVEAKSRSSHRIFGLVEYTYLGHRHTCI
jgi:hypothetical protein